MKEETGKRSWGWKTLRVLLLALVAGAGAGVVSSVWTSRSLDEYAKALLAERRLPEVSTQKPSPIPGTYEEALSRVRDSARTSVATLLPISDDETSPANWLSTDDALGYGVVVSDDGWVLVDASALQDVRDPVEDIEVWIGGKAYAITSVFRDVLTSAVMLNTDATGVSAVGFATANNVRAGEMMFAVDGNDGVLPTAVVVPDATFSALPEKAEVFATEWILDGAAVALSMPLMNGAGELTGLVQAGEVSALPLHHAMNALRDVLRSGTTAYPALGAYVLDLSHAYNISSDLKQNLRAGALVIAPNATTRVTVRGGAAAQAGIAANDIILAVDGESVTEAVTLAEILIAYDPGDIARFTILRAGQTITLSVTLSDYVNLVY